MSDEIRIQHVFRDEATGFCDAIVLPKADYEKLKPNQIEALKAERIANWQAALDAPQPEPTKEDVEAEAVAFADEIKAIEARRDSLVQRLTDVGADSKLILAVDMAWSSSQAENAALDIVDAVEAVAEGK